MSLKRISPEEAHELVTDGGYAYLDVRSVPEYEAGHPTGAFNIPLMHRGAAGMEPNPAFADVVQGVFPKDAKLVLGCQGGGRSKRAAEMLLGLGYTNVVDQRAGFLGSKDPFGKVSEPGWQPKGLPVTPGLASIKIDMGGGCFVLPQ